MQENETQSWKTIKLTPEFLLVIVMLVVLTILVIVVLWAPVPQTGASDATAKDMLDYRKSILAVIITAFGAWVGAGAAYYFGRENLREAASSLLAMREPSPKERLRRTPIREIPPTSLDWIVKNSDELKPVLDKLKAEPERWFTPIVKDAGTIDTVIHEEAIWRFVDKETEAGTAYADILEKKMSDVIKYIKDTPGLKRVEGIYVAVTFDKSVGDAYELMQNKDVYLAIIMDERGKPTHFITAGDVRKVSLQVG
jgi:hypothetical protein